MLQGNIAAPEGHTEQASETMLILTARTMGAMVRLDLLATGECSVTIRRIDAPISSDEEVVFAGNIAEIAGTVIN